MARSELLIKDIRARAVVAPLARPILTSVGVIPSAPLVLIDVFTDQGIFGRSYLFGYSAVTLRPLVELLSNLGEMIKGKRVVPVERMDQFTRAFRLLGRQGLLGMAISGLDMAFWDALARAHETSVVRLLGGTERAVPAYASFGMIDPVRDAAEIEESLRQGFTAIKIKIGGGSLDDDIKAVAGAREIIGEGMRLMVDYNQSLTVPEAQRRINRLAAYDLTWVEEPVPAENLSGHARVRAGCRVPIQTGENWWFPEDIARAVALKASDCAMLDIMKIGGVTGWLRAGGQAEGASLPVSSHIFVEASAHVLLVTPTADFLEYLDIASAILKDPIQAENGAVRPRGPGLGMDWNENAIDRFAI